jgi:uncharacterized protein with PQ loop repeat
MSHFHPIELLGILGGAIGLIQSLPQIKKIWNLHEHDGISTTTYIFFMVSGWSWFTYGVRTHSIAQMVVNPIGQLMTITILVLIMGKSLKTLLSLSAITLLTFIIVFFIPLWLLNALLTGFLFSRVPQVVKSWQTFRHGADSAVSVLSWTISIISCIPWIIYGVATDRGLIVLTTTLSLVFSAIIISLELGAKRKVRLNLLE